jgi:hypothetical protein
MDISGGAEFMPVPLKPKPTEPTFMDIVQEHERAWGTQSYSNRPTLAQLLSAPVVIIWQSADQKELHQMMTVHQNLDDLHKYATRLLIHSKQELPKRRMVAVYVNQKKVSIQGVKVLLSS